MPLIDLNGLRYFKSKENAMIAGKPEAGALATNTHLVDEYFYWKGTLHQATAPISVGDAIALGTNVKIGVLADGITEAKSATYGLYDQESVGSAAVVSFDDGAENVPLKNLSVNIKAVQDLHGYDNPWGAGWGKNLIPDTTDTSNGYVNNNYLASDGTAGSLNGRYISEYFPITAGATYTVSQKGALQTASLCFYDSNKTYISGEAYDERSSFTITAPENAAYCRATQRGDRDNNSYLVQIELGSTATTILPYSNICPTTGWTGANVTRMGKNLLNPSILRDGSSWNYFSLKLKPNTTYTISANFASNSGLAFYASSDEAYGANTRVYSGHPVMQTTGNGGYLYFQQRRTSGEDSFANYIAQVEEGSSATTLEPYVGTTIPITFPSEAGTVYGGTLDVTNGVLTVSSAKKVFTGEETLYISRNSAASSYLMLRLGERGFVTYNFAYSNMLNRVFSDISTSDFSFIIQNSANYDRAQIAFRLNASFDGGNASGTIANYKAELARLYTNGTPLEVIYNITQPTTYTLTPTEVSTLLGLNNILADCGDVLELTYRKKAISEEKIQYLIDAKNTLTKALIAPVLTDMIADTVLVAGDFRIVGDTLYRITTPVASGANLIVNTNCVVTTIGEQLTYINSVISTLGNLAFQNYDTVS